jgi:A/G-specific adenine glycosylase
LKYWQGLGYYTRARNIYAGAVYLIETCKGIFPNTYDEILKIKGVGSYTAAAIASFAFHLPYPVIDGNVFCAVLSRPMAYMILLIRLLEKENHGSC